MRKLWNAQIASNPGSLGVHIDHKDPSVTFHLPGFRGNRTDELVLWRDGRHWSLRAKPIGLNLGTDRSITSALCVRRRLHPR